MSVSFLIPLVDSNWWPLRYRSSFKGILFLRSIMDLYPDSAISACTQLSHQHTGASQALTWSLVKRSLTIVHDAAIFHMSLDIHCMPHRIKLLIHWSWLHHIPAAMPPPETIWATLNNACDVTRGIAAHFRSVSPLCYFWRKQYKAAQSRMSPATAQKSAQFSR